MNAVIRWIVAIVVTALAPAGAWAAGEHPLFASDDMIQVTIKGPVSTVARTGGKPSDPKPATIAGPGSPDALPIVLAPRGLSRRAGEMCRFGPLRVEFTQPPPANSIFAHQKKLKLVTHCRPQENFQQYLLLEYAAYKLYNVLTPNSFKVRLATVNYVQENGKPLISRLGFFIEDTDDAAKRNGMHEAKVGARIAASQLSPRDAARESLFQYMISNLDWALVAGPAGESCCHNTKLVGPAPGNANQLVPIPYDFDLSGFVDPPYAFPPESLPVTSVKDRLYRGYCIHNAQALAVASEFRARRSQLRAVLDSIPQLDTSTRRDGLGFLEGFFNQLGADGSTPSFLKGCLN